MPEDLVLAVDQGTSSTKCILVDATGAVVARASAPVGISYPQPGWVEQDPDELVSSVVEAASRCLEGHDVSRVAAVGLSTQRESVLLWDKESGRPVTPVLGWQDRRATDICDQLRSRPDSTLVRRLSGLPIDPMFSAPKVRWLLDAHDPDRSLSAAGRLALGTVDAWLVHALVGGHDIEVGNAARTQLLDVTTGSWSAELLDLFRVPPELLPVAVPSNADRGRMSSAAGVLEGLPIRGVLGDSHAALFAHGPAAADAVKVTYGTGSSAMRLVPAAGDVPEGVCVTVAWGEPAARTAAEGNIRSTGATVAWLAGVMGMSPQALADLAAGADNGGVHLVPAFGGLAAPWWDDTAVGLLSGITLGTGQANIARAAVESIAYQVDDLVRSMTESEPASALLVDGGGSSNGELMQLQADLAGVPVRRPHAADLSALGAAYLAGDAAGLWSAGSRPPLTYDEFAPAMPREEASRLRDAWSAAVARSRLRVL